MLESSPPFRKKMYWYQSEMTRVDASLAHGIVKSSSFPRSPSVVSEARVSKLLTRVRCVCALSIQRLEGRRWRLRRMRANAYGNSVFSLICKLLVLRYLENEHVGEPQSDTLRWALTSGTIAREASAAPAASFKSGSGKFRERSAGALGTDCPKTPLLTRPRVTDFVCPELRVLDAHKELFLKRRSRRSLALSELLLRQGLLLLSSEFNRVQNSSRGQQLARLFRYVHVERSTKYLFVSRDIREPHTCRISDLKGKGEERFFATCRRRPEVASNSLLPRSRAYKTATGTCPARSFTRYWVYYRCFGLHRGRQITG